MTTFTIPGKPFAKQRPRFSIKTGRAYTPRQTVSFERHVGEIASDHFPKPITGPVLVEIWATFMPAKSWSNKKRQAHMGTYHTQKPDADNCLKAILDGLNGVAFVDDSHVSDVHFRKIWGPCARTVVTVEEIT